MYRRYYFILLVACVGFSISTYCAFGQTLTKGTVAVYNNGDNKSCEFLVEFAVTPMELSRGLMFRESLAANAGMFFIFQDESIRKFWMKDTRVPLDIIFINSSFKVIDVHYHAKPMDTTTIVSKVPARYVLEIKAGIASSCKIQTGTGVKFLNIVR